MSPPDDVQPMRGRAQPERSVVAGDPRLTILDHPLVDDLLGRARDSRATTIEFGAVASQVAGGLLWEACRDLRTASVEVPGFDGRPIDVPRRAERVAGVVILRAGLLFAAPFRQLLPDAPLFQVGVRRDERTLDVTVYTANLPSAGAWAERVLLLDPMLATGNTTVAALRYVRATHRGRVDVLALIAAPVGAAATLAADPDARVICAALDDTLDGRGYIVPGLGDAGDRLFGTPGN